PRKYIPCVNQLYEITTGESIPVHELPSYIKEKLQEKQKIDEEIKDANDTLQNTSVTVEAVNEHLKLKEQLDKHGYQHKTLTSF
ncbi:MAG: hypothetical protein ACJ71I_01620, partial [Nitrososphaeraceae archaeon]